MSTIDVDTTRLRPTLATVEKQSRFAASRAINDGAKAGQQGLFQAFEDAFVLRRPAFIKREGAKIQKFARREDLQAVVGATERAAFLSDHIAGSVRRPAPGRTKLAVPAGVRRTNTGVISRPQRPGALLDRPGTFIRGDRAGSSALLKKTGRGKRGTLKVLWWLVRQVRVRPVLGPGLARARQAAHKEAVKRFPERLADALRTAR